MKITEYSFNHVLPYPPVLPHFPFAVFHFAHQMSIILALQTIVFLVKRSHLIVENQERICTQKNRLICCWLYFDGFYRYSFFCGFEVNMFSCSVELLFSALRDSSYDQSLCTLIRSLHLRANVWGVHQWSFLFYCIIPQVFNFLSLKVKKKKKKKISYVVG